MKSFVKHILLSGTVLLSLASCRGNLGNDTGDTAGGLELSADRTSIAADGRETVTFTVKCGGLDVSTEKGMRIRISETGEEAAQSWLASGKNTFSAIAAGRYSVSAIYTDAERNVYESDNIEITLSDAGVLPPSYTRMMLFTQFTSVGCVNCPEMTKSLSKVQADRPGILVPVAMHIAYDSNYPDPMATSLGQSIARRFEVTGIPRGFVNYNKALSANSEISTINSALDKALAETVKPCGVALSTAYDKASGRVTADLKVTPSERGYYRYQVFLIEDGISYFQLNGGDDYVHNRVLRDGLSSNLMGEKLNEGLSPVPWVEISGSKSAYIEDGWNADNMKVVAAVFYAKDSGDDYYCLNTVECALGESADYQQAD